jgi:hypothetical protein
MNLNPQLKMLHGVVTVNNWLQFMTNLAKTSKEWTNLLLPKWTQL